MMEPKHDELNRPHGESGEINDPSERRAFTLLELLVAVGCIAILAATLLPAMAKTGPKTTLAGCLSNQRQIVQAWTLYAIDNQNTLLPPVVDGKVLRAGGFFPWQEFPLDGDPRVAQSLSLAQMSQSPLSAYVHDVTVFHCPGDLRWRELAVGRGWSYESYSKAHGMHGDDFTSWGIKPYVKLSSIHSPQESLVSVEEADPRGGNMGTWVMNTQPPGWVDPFGIFHGTASTFSFADGHAESHQWTDEATIRAAKRSADGVPSFYRPGGNSSNPDFVWVWERYRYVGWAPLP